MKDHWELDFQNTGQQENQMTGLRFFTLKSKNVFDLSNIFGLLASGLHTKNETIQRFAWYKRKKPVLWFSRVHLYNDIFILFEIPGT